jgi:STE24 endopeptidase
MEASFYTKIFLIALFTKSLIESYLDKRNMDNILINRSAVPEKFRDQISLSDHQKAADYSIEKIKASQVFHLVDLVIFLALTLMGGLELINQFAVGFSTSSPIITGLYFFAILGIFTAVTSLPKSIYFTFVIEEKYGFNKTTWKTFVGDMAKAALLTVILGVPIASAILWIMAKLGSNWWVYAFIFLTVIQLLLVFIFPTFIAPIFNKFSPLEDGVVKWTWKCLFYWIWKK